MLKKIPLVIAVFFCLNGVVRSQEKATVYFRADQMTPYKIDTTSVIRLIGNVVFFHNDAVILCDTAIRHSERHMEGRGNVLINKDSTFVYGDRFTYDGETNIARVYSPIVKMIDKDAVLYTFNLEFNTLLNLGKYYGGGTITQKDNLMESDEGDYYADTRDVVLIGNVSMKNDDYKIKSDSVGYNMDTEIVTFFRKADIWNKNDEFLTADRGHYFRSREVYEFAGNTYALTREQELWADSLVYDSRREEAELYRNIQVLDTVQRAYSFGDLGHYWGGEKNNDTERLRIFMTENPSLVAYEEKGDTTYMRSDTMLIYSMPLVMAEAEMKARSAENPDESDPFYSPEDTLSDERMPASPPASFAPDSLRGKTDAAIADSLNGFAPESAGSTKQGDDPPGESVTPPDSTAGTDLSLYGPALPGKEKNAEETSEKKRPSGKEPRKKQKDAEKTADPLPVVAEEPFLSPAGTPKDTLPASISGSSGQPELRMPAQETGYPAEEGRSLPQELDSVRTDSLENQAQLSPPQTDKDSIAYRIHAFYKVKIFRNDMQAISDSLVSFSIDSTLHMYKEPVIWSDSTQILSKKVVIYTENQQISRAHFTGNPIMGQLVGEGKYNQVTGREIEAFFIDNEIHRADVLGNAETFYYMEDEGEVVAFMVSTCAFMEIWFEERKISRIKWFEKPEYTIFPIDKIPASQPTIMAGFEWKVDMRPKDKTEVFDRTILPSFRIQAESLPQPVFPITQDIGKKKILYREQGIWNDRSEPVTVDLGEFRNQTVNL